MSNWKEAIAASVAGATVTGRNPYFRDGNYTVLVEALKLEDKRSGKTFIGEFRIVTADPVWEGVTPNQPGTVASVVAILDGKNKEVAFGKIKKLMMAFGAPQDAIAPYLLAVCNDGTDPDLAGKPVQPLRGASLRVETYRTPTKSQKERGVTDPNEWKTFENFIEVPNQSAESIAAGRAQLDKTPTAAAPAPDSPPASQQTAAPEAAPSLLDKLGI